MPPKKTPLQLFDKRYAILKKQFETGKLRAEFILKKRQERCEHKFSFIMGTGNNDSYYRCNQCGIEK